MCIGVGPPDGGQRRERPLNGDQVGDEMQHSASPDRHLRCPQLRYHFLC